jgi:hypothetical protein
MLNGLWGAGWFGAEEAVVAGARRFGWSLGVVTMLPPLYGHVICGYRVPPWGWGTLGVS